MKNWRKKKESSATFCEIVDELLHFKTYAANTEVIGLEKKLENGRRLQYLNFAEKIERKIHEKATQKMNILKQHNIYMLFCWLKCIQDLRQVYILA